MPSALEYEFVNNPEPRCPVVLLLDTSHSMVGKPIAELNEAIKLFAEASLRVDISVVTFGSSPKIIQEFVTADSFVPPVLATQGTTPLGKALELGLDILEKRKASYDRNRHQYYRPWMFVISDGEPTDEWQRPAELVRKSVKGGHLVLYVIGVGGADFSILNQIAVDNSALSMETTDFKPLFKWLSASLKIVGHSSVTDQLEAPKIEFTRFKH
jgi:uncharacterized protein YegL